MCSILRVLLTDMPSRVASLVGPSEFFATLSACCNTTLSVCACLVTRLGRTFRIRRNGARPQRCRCGVRLQAFFNIVGRAIVLGETTVRLSIDGERVDEMDRVVWWDSLVNLSARRETGSSLVPYSRSRNPRCRFKRERIDWRIRCDVEQRR
jgi:hypothetical protein